MRKKRFVIGLVMGIALAVAGGSVEARDKSLHASFAGTATNKDDFSFAGTPAFYNTFAGKSTLGQYTGQLVVELQPDGNPCTVAGGGSGVEFVFVGEVVVLSFAAKGKQLFLNLSPGVASHGCLDPTTGVFIGQTTFDVSGGTGRFAGATGTIIKTWKAIFLALPASPGKGAFASFTGTFDGTIEFAK
ncbi:MAG TPA: hypothetical protein VGX03_32585 [Candidatus Binatia bacterium]|jgi:hypothetical protein|nr:hypothetical protein [Candidatus Binatia bacterium]